jgi:8-oxo-dGTP pyrophosphatase MutT (NUDIX family)
MPPAKKISLDNAKTDKLFYFVANVVVYRPSDKTCLILKRHHLEKAHPGKFGVLGGKLEWANLDLHNPTRVNGDILDYENAVEDLLNREVFEEAAITIEPELIYLNSVAFIRPDEIPVILVKYAAKYKSGDVKLEEDSFTDFAWVDKKQVKNFPTIDGVKEEVAKTIELFKNK